jgi:hypothetical protein
VLSSLLAVGQFGRQDGMGSFAAQRYVLDSVRLAEPRSSGSGGILPSPNPGEFVH